MSRRTITTILVLALVGTTWIILALALRGDGLRLATGATVPAGLVSGVGPVEPLPGSSSIVDHTRTAEQEAPSPGSLQLEVVDEAGSAVPAARVFPWMRAQREARASSAIGRTGADGILTLAEYPTKRMSGTRGLAVLAPGFIPAVLAWSELSQPVNRIILHRGASQHVSCHDVAGLPMSGCTVLMSRLALRRTREKLAADPLEPAGDPSVVVFRGVTDGNGQCEITGLEPGLYDLSVEADCCVMIDSQTGNSCSVPGGAIDIAMGRVAACIVDLAGDEILEHAFVYIGYEVSGMMKDSLDLIEAQLEQSHPGKLIAVAAQGSIADPEPIELRVFLRQKGYATFAAPMHPLDELSVTKLDASALAGQPMGGLSINALDAGGHPVDIPGFYVQVGQGAFDGLRLALRQGAPNRLPEGQYALGHSEHFLRGHYEPSFVKVPGTTHITLDGVYRPCRVSVRGLDGVACEQFALRIEAAGQKLSAWIHRQDPPVYWLPVGPAVITAQALGYAECATKVEIEDSGYAEPQTVSIQLLRAEPSTVGARAR